MYPCFVGVINAGLNLCWKLNARVNISKIFWFGLNHKFRVAKKLAKDMKEIFFGFFGFQTRCVLPFCPLV
jgi:hypothetical protein